MTMDSAVFPIGGCGELLYDQQAAFAGGASHDLPNRSGNLQQTLCAR
ncbi:MAG: hypothetical protein HY835_01945 [Anaerolineae bacterium]|nr:hypothetical protein [Anaerolineae bacterium]